MTKQKKKNRNGPNKHKNHVKRAKKQKSKQKLYIKNKEKEKRVAEITKFEVYRAVSTLPIAGTSREPLNDQNVPKSYLQHRIRKVIEPGVDKFFGITREEEKEEDLIQNNAKITPQASYDFDFDNQ